MMININEKNNPITYFIVLSFLLLMVMVSPQLWANDNEWFGFENKPVSPPKILPKTTVNKIKSPIKFIEVFDVSPWDHLNIRVNPSSEAPTIGSIPFDAKGISAEGAEMRIGEDSWKRVRWQNIEGWANMRYLRPEQTTNQNRSTTPQVSPLPQNPPQTAGKNSNNRLQCGGVDPFWDVRIQDDQMKVDLRNGTQFNVPVIYRRLSSNNSGVSVTGGKTKKHKVMIFLENNNRCSDGMSTIIYPYSATLMVGSGKVMSGCCTVASTK